MNVLQTAQLNGAVWAALSISAFSHQALAHVQAGVPLLLPASMAPAAARTVRADEAPERPAQNAPDLAAWLQHLAEQVRQLRLDVIQQRMELQEQKVNALERELAGIRKEQLRLQTDERAHAAQLADVDQQLANQSLPQEDRAQVEAVRAALLSAGSERFRSEQAALAQREGELRQRLRGMQQSLNSLSEKAKALIDQGGGPRH